MTAYVRIGNNNTALSSRGSTSMLYRQCNTGRAFAERALPLTVDHMFLLHPEDWSAACGYADNNVRCASGSMRFAAPLEKIMGSADLQGQLVLVVEDEPLVAFDLAEAFEAKGAKVTTASNVSHALTLAEGGGIAGAVLDYELADGNCAGVCHVLKSHNVPFIIYSGVKPESATTADAPQLSKPADPDVVVRMLNRLIANPRYSPIASLSRSSLTGLERN